MITLIRTAVEQVSGSSPPLRLRPFREQRTGRSGVGLFRGKVVIATKFGFAYDENGEQVGLSIRF
jgi:hypothetical protein